ncbi:TPA: helix-turn-helix domain-containing protein [Pasteurella multocida]|uniref:helix-turn-helix domain-containing protein n=1 Tax=Pasteurella multocida TaxID=747 RepID=UPI00189BC9DA|nr:helix-turn-helix domain-containing protein [Pasteurella multocida]MBF6985743.1 helix-turn-helix domain-containing protein [Pasteurella multocida]MCL7759255.1 helix-turn-helix domain-containing protein [Pasteurella multocida]MCL7787741.1 helix-turn-helix domain-containing protein [Pasteurella multocida]MDX3892443.1 helix-turn-helix domain-containing protein [Pasteurella multocida]MEB3494796.1 helix-turn-helix domain-containing protein [Pasteurella multocida]
MENSLQKQNMSICVEIEFNSEQIHVLLSSESILERAKQEIYYALNKLIEKANLENQLIQINESIMQLRAEIGQSSNVQNEVYLTVEQVEKIYHTSRSKLDRLAREGKLRKRKMGSCTMYSKIEIEQFIDECSKNT